MPIDTRRVPIYHAPDKAPGWPWFCLPAASALEAAMHVSTTPPATRHDGQRPGTPLAAGAAVFWPRAEASVVTDARLDIRETSSVSPSR